MQTEHVEHGRVEVNLVYTSHVEHFGSDVRVGYYQWQACDPAKVPYCITHALIEAVKGNVEEGLFFCGANVGRLDRMRTVQELMDELVTEWRQNQ